VIHFIKAKVRKMAASGGASKKERFIHVTYVDDENIRLFTLFQHFIIAILLPFQRLFPVVYSESQFTFNVLAIRLSMN